MTRGKQPLPARQPLSDAELQASLMDTLTDWNGRSPLWVFAYGSLIWKPEFAFDRRVPARVFGYHRRLCLRSIKYRGTEARPGVVARAAWALAAAAAPAAALRAPSAAARLAVQ